MNRVIARSYVLGVRASDEFIGQFDNHCLRLGYNRSEGVRYCLKRFLYELWNNAEIIQKAQKEMF